MLVVVVMGWREWVKIWDGVEEGCNNIALKRRQRGEQISILTANDVTGWLFSSRKNLVGLTDIDS